jgi:hypothetical protein
MAEIKLERKGTPIWPWILGLLLLAALLWYFLGRDSDATTTGDTTAVGATGAAVAPATGIDGNPAGEEGFIAYVDRNDTSGETEANHQYTADGIRRLAAMLQTSGGGANDGPWITMSTIADSLQLTGPGDDRHADMAKRAFQLAVGAMGSGAGVAQARTAAEAIDTARPLGEQTAQVRIFFERARDVMRSMPSAGAR